MRYRKARQNPVTAEELWKHRELNTANGTLQTGVTNVCNAKCTFCAYPKVVANKTLETGVMSMEVFKKAVDEWVIRGGENVDLTPVVGDPLIDPGLFQKIEYAAQAKVKKVFLTTNAILLNRNEAYKRLVDLKVAGIFISTQGATREAYEKVYGVKQYDEVMSGLRNLLSYNREKGEPVAVGIRFRNSEKPSEILKSKDFQENIKPFLSAQVRINFTVDFDNWGGTILPTDMKGVMKLRRLPPPLNVPCRSLFGFTVRHDGKVRLCGCRLTRNDNDDLVVGNVKENSLVDITLSETTWRKIEGFYRGERPETCRECTFYVPIDRAWLQRRQSSRPAAAEPAK
jgi:MoaA/NifB/PqqE/SkfB family radical SAM enzyme